MKVAVLSLGMLVAVAASVRAEEESIKPSDLPKAVVSAVKAKFPKGEITKAAKEEDHGKTIYEAIVTVEGKTIDVAVSAKGKILEIEQPVEVAKLPEAVASALKAKYPEAKIKKAEHVVKFEDEGDDDDEEEKFFEVVLASEGKAAFEVKISAKGKVLKGEEEEDEKDEKSGKKKDKD